jgi:hypothetical protein
MKIDSKTLRRIIKEELQAVLDEDYSQISNMTPGDALAYMEEHLNGRTWVFWDLETIGFKGQITQYGALAFKIEDLAGPAPTQPIDSFEMNVKLNSTTVETMQREEEILSRADEIYNAEIDAYENGEEVSKDFKLVRSARRAKEQGRPYTVRDMLEYTQHSPAETDVEERDALQLFVDWFTSLEGPLVSAGHNIMSFDRRRIMEEGERLNIDVSVFADLDTFDTLNFQKELFQHIARDRMGKGHEGFEAFFTAAQKKVKGELHDYMKFSGKLQTMMNSLYGPGPDYVQLHTAVDDTRQMVNSFFKIYAHVRDMSQDEDVAGLTSHINVRKARKELGDRNISDPIDISRATSQFRRD